MAIEWYYINSYVAMGVDWQASDGTTTVSLTPKVYRWDEYRTDNSGGRYSETLSPDPVGAGSWDDLTFGSGSGERLLDTFATRTYNKGTGSVKLTLSWNSSFGSWYNGKFQTIGAGSHTWTYTLPAMPTYTITYNANGGDLNGIAQTQTKTHGTDLTVPSTEPERRGYTFLEWNTESDGSGYGVAPGGEISGNESKTMYAIWQPNMYHVILDCRGGKTQDGQESVQYNAIFDSFIGGLNYGQSLPTPIRPGYDFVGWNDKEDGEGAYYTGSETMNVVGGMVLYAVWELATSLVTIYVDGQPRHGMVHMYNSSGNLCYGIVTVYDEKGIGRLAV